MSKSSRVSSSLLKTVGRTVFCLLTISAISFCQTASLKPVGVGPFTTGTAFWVEVRVGDPNAVTNLYGINFKLHSSAATCTYVEGSAVAGTFLGASSVTFFQKADNQTVDMTVSKTGSPGASGTGLIAKAQFISSVNSDVIFTLTNVTANDPTGASITLDVSSATVTVGGGGEVRSFYLRDSIFLCNVYSATGSDWTLNKRQYVKSSIGWKTPFNAGSTRWGNFERTTNSCGGVSLPSIDAATDSFYIATVAEYMLLSPTFISLKFGLKDGLSANVADVRFVVQIKDGTSYTTLLDSTLNYFDSGWKDFQSSLSAWKGKNVVLRLITDPVTVDWEDWSQWNAVDVTVDKTALAVDQREDQRVSEYLLLQNYPNPFNPSTTIRFAIPQRANVHLSVFNTLGQQVAELVNGEVGPGFHEILFEARNLASGVYFYRLQAGTFTDTKRLLLMR